MLIFWSTLVLCRIFQEHFPFRVKWDIKSDTVFQNTALHMSAAGGHVDAVRMLLNKNASPTMLNSYKKSALDMALDYEQVDVAVAMMKHKK